MSQTDGNGYLVLSSLYSMHVHVQVLRVPRCRKRSHHDHVDRRRFQRVVPLDLLLHEDIEHDALSNIILLYLLVHGLDSSIDLVFD